MKLLVSLMALAALVYLPPVESRWNSYSLHLKPSNKVAWDNFHANVSIELNFGHQRETFDSDAFMLDPVFSGSYSAVSNATIDAIESVRFKYVSVESPDDKFALDLILIGQYYFRGMYVFHRYFTLEGPQLLEQNHWYTGYPSK